MQDAEENIALGKRVGGRERDERGRRRDAGDPSEIGAEPDAASIGEHEPDADQQQERPGDEVGRGTSDRRQRVIFRRQPQETQVP